MGWVGWMVVIGRVVGSLRAPSVLIIRCCDFVAPFEVWAVVKEISLPILQNKCFGTKESHRCTYGPDMKGWWLTDRWM